MVSNANEIVNKLQDARTSTENLKYMVMKTGNTGAHYLLSNTQQDANTYLNNEAQLLSKMLLKHQVT